ncbi:bacillithiol system redox-active protein YtxJ [Symbiobacterium thermophilum]|uniref:Bacillithiol system redox-active protein YtxJ n=1 Tax=Symbiobacterium thermophilum TaxID=2734 RepID=A0A953IBT9_SYMTR|nr:bacillithiol system redox-active protein YtxJ [Symbiobacterium thermophilum]MBY6275275.1 bacillithiol system redox-active protein YtxJ [Symbiobacterium thermophilum]
MAEARQILTPADVDAVIEASRKRPVLVFKHSTRCPISAAAHREWSAFLAGPEAERADHFWVRVIQERPVSLALASRVGVPHQSPQVLLIRDGRAVWHASHYAITAGRLKAALDQAAAQR